MNINEKLEKIFNSDYKVIIRNVERYNGLIHIILIIELFGKLI